MKHKFQHPDEPTWCVYCGTFKRNCIPDEECDAVTDEERFDSSKPENFTRMADELLGLEAAQ